MNDFNPKEVFLAGPCYVSFPKLTDPNKQGKYTLALLFEEKDAKVLTDRVKAVLQNQFGKAYTDKIYKQYNPVKAADEKNNAENYGGYIEGRFAINASSKFPIDIVDAKRVPIIGAETIKEEIYPGVLVRVGLTCYWYSVKTEDGSTVKGVSFGIRHLQKLKSTPPFVIRQSAEDFFDDAEDDTDSTDYEALFNA